MLWGISSESSSSHTSNRWVMLFGNFPSELKVLIISFNEICERVHSKTYRSGERLEREELPLSGQRKDFSCFSCK